MTNYIGYDDYIQNAREQMIKSGHTNIDDENAVREYVIRRGIFHVPRLGKLTFDECILLTDLYSLGFSVSKKYAVLEKEQLEFLAKNHIKNGFSLDCVDVGLLSSEFINDVNQTQVKEYIVNKFLGDPNATEIIFNLCSPSMEYAVRIVKNNFKGLILIDEYLKKHDQKTDIDFNQLVEIHMDAGYGINVIPKEYISEKVLDHYFFDNGVYLKSDEIYGYYSFMFFIDKMSFRQLSLVVKEYPESLLKSKDVWDEFEKIYKESKNMFTTEYAMMYNLLQNNTLQSENVKELFDKGAIDINILYNAYNEFKIEKYLNEER